MFKAILAALLLALSATQADAEWRVYIVPTVASTGTAPNQSRKPKYFHNATVSAASWSLITYGMEPWMIVVADLSGADHTLLAGQADVTALPSNLDAAITAGNVTTIVAKLDSMNVPSGWVKEGMTWREVLRKVINFFTLLQSYEGHGGTTPIFSSATLNTTVGNLSQATRDRIQAVADDAGLSTTAINGSTTVRQMLQILVDQMQTHEITFTGGSI